MSLRVMSYDFFGLRGIALLRFLPGGVDCFADEDPPFGGVTRLLTNGAFGSVASFLDFDDSLSFFDISRARELASCACRPSDESFP